MKSSTIFHDEMLIDSEKTTPEEAQKKLLSTGLGDAFLRDSGMLVTARPDIEWYAPWTGSQMHVYTLPLFMIETPKHEVRRAIYRDSIRQQSIHADSMLMVEQTYLYNPSEEKRRAQDF